MRQNSAYLLLYERKPLLTGSLRRGMTPAGTGGTRRSSAVGEEKEKEKGKVAVSKSETAVKGMPAEEKGVNADLKSEAKGIRDSDDADDKFASDSWDAVEVEMEADREAKEGQQKDQQKEEHREVVESALEEIRAQKAVINGDTDLPPIAKKVLQAVWTENLEFQTDRSLFNR